MLNAFHVRQNLRGLKGKNLKLDLIRKKKLSEKFAPMFILWSKIIIISVVLLNHPYYTKQFRSKRLCDAKKNYDLLVLYVYNVLSTNITEWE